MDDEHTMGTTGRVTTPVAERRAYAQWAQAEAQRLDDVACAAEEFAFTDFARDCRLEASFLRDRAAQALESVA
jgi:hypothetical protein